MKLSNILTGKIISNDIIKKRATVIISVVGIIVLYLFTMFYYQYTYRELLRAKKELTIVRAKSSTINAEKVRLTRESNIMRMIEEKNIPLVKNNEPPKKIE